MFEKLNDLRTYIGVAVTALIGLELGGWVEGDAETVADHVRHPLKSCRQLCNWGYCFLFPMA